MKSGWIIALLVILSGTAVAHCGSCQVNRSYEKKTVAYQTNHKIKGLTVKEERAFNALVKKYDKEKRALRAKEETVDETFYKKAKSILSPSQFKAYLDATDNQVNQQSN